MAASSNSASFVDPERLSLLDVIDIEWTSVLPEVVIPFTANRVNMLFSLRIVTSHSGSFEYDITLSINWLASSRVSMAPVSIQSV
jgi:hypothetical protein